MAPPYPLQAACTYGSSQQFLDITRSVASKYFGMRGRPMQAEAAKARKRQKQLQAEAGARRQAAAAAEEVRAAERAAAAWAARRRVVCETPASCAGVVPVHGVGAAR